MIYICGPMTGHADYNYPEFHRVAGILRKHGLQVVNPAENTPPVPPTWENYMRMAIAQVAQATGIATIDGWDESRGATLEMHIAENLQIPRMHWENWLP